MRSRRTSHCAHLLLNRDDGCKRVSSDLGIQQRPRLPVLIMDPICRSKLRGPRQRCKSQTTLHVSTLLIDVSSWYALECRLSSRQSTSARRWHSVLSSDSPMPHSPSLTSSPWDASASRDFVVSRCSLEDFHSESGEALSTTSRWSSS